MLSWLPQNVPQNMLSCWSKLPDDVLELILLRLLPSDYLKCRDVCPSWRAAIDSKRCPPAYQLPWLLLDSCNTYYFKDGCFVRDGKVYKSKYVHRFYRPGCVGAIEGWLIMTTLPQRSEKWNNNSKLNDFFFLNPLTGARILLASHPAHSQFLRIKAVASSVPTRLQQRRCYVSFLVFGNHPRLAFCAPGDRAWTSIEAEWDDPALEFHDVEIVDGKLYAVGGKALEFLMVFDIQLDTNGCGIHTYTAQRFVTLHPYMDCIFEGPAYRRDCCYLVKGSDTGELYMILHKHDRYTTRGFQVWKLEDGVTSAPRWVKIVNLGDQVLFIGALNNKFISLGTTTSHDKTLERNSIYFVFTSTRHNSGVFSLTNKSLKPLNVQIKGDSGIDRTVWFTPTSL